MEDRGACPSLLLHGEKTLASAVKTRLVSCCPTMDLVAVVCQDAHLDVYRFNGQRAFGFQPASAESVIKSICWKFNGTYIML